jgi:hypothetical protein
MQMLDGRRALARVTPMAGLLQGIIRPNIEGRETLRTACAAGLKTELVINLSAGDCDAFTAACAR